MTTITLQQWADNKGLTLKTAQRYAREKRISPAPVRLEGGYVVAADAVLLPVIGSRGWGIRRKDRP
jgi:hypothetical protein